MHRTLRPLAGIAAAAGLLAALLVAAPAAASGQPAILLPDSGYVQQIACSLPSYCLVATSSPTVSAFVNDQLTSGYFLGSDFDSGNGVACPEALLCFVVGTGEANEGTVWEIDDGVLSGPSLVPGINQLEAIACDAGTTNCLAVGTASGSHGEIVELADGSPTGAAQAITGAGGFDSVVCPAPGSCIAGAGIGTAAGAILPVVDGVPGTLQPLSLAVGALACESPTDCWGGAGGDVFQIVDGVASTPVAEPPAYNFGGASCPSATQCYLTGRDLDDGVGVIVPVSNDVVGTPQIDSSVAQLAGITCPSPSECIGAGMNHSARWVLIPDVVAPPPPVILGVSFSGAGGAVQLSVSGSGFGDWAPLPDPSAPDVCAAGDSSFDFDTGVLQLTDTTGGWSAGGPDSCVGLVIELWTDNEVVLGFGSSYVYPRLEPEDSYELTIEGTTFSGTAAVPAPRPASVSSVSFRYSAGTIDVSVTGSGFGTVQPPSPGTVGCTSGDTSRDFESDALSLADANAGWTGGEVGDCLGLSITRWTNSIVQFHLGAYYPSVTPMADGDSYTLDLLGTVTTGSTSVANLPAITGVSLTGAGTALVVTVSGSGLGPAITRTTAASCGGSHPGKVYPTGALTFVDSTAGWTAGSPGNCIGLNALSWTASTVRFSFGSGYALYGIVQDGDAISVTVHGVTFSGTATLATPPTVDSVTFSGSGRALTVTITGANFGPAPPNVGSPGCAATDTSKDFAPGVLDFTDEDSGWTAGQAGDCIGLGLTKWSSTSIAFRFGKDYALYPPVAAGDGYDLVIFGTAYESTAPTPL